MRQHFGFGFVFTESVRFPGWNPPLFSNSYTDGGVDCLVDFVASVKKAGVDRSIDIVGNSDSKSSGSGRFKLLVVIGWAGRTDEASNLLVIPT